MEIIWWICQKWNTQLESEGRQSQKHQTRCKEEIQRWNLKNIGQASQRSLKNGSSIAGEKETWIWRPFKNCKI